MGIFDKIKKGINSILGNDESGDKSAATPATPAAPDYNPEGKPLEWFSSEEGMETYKKYVTAQTYILEDTYKEEHKHRFSQYEYDIYLTAVHRDAIIPSKFFAALADAIKVQPLELQAPSEHLVKCLEKMAKPFSINDDGEPEACEPVLPPDRLVSVEKNPLLNFVANFNAFEIKDDALGAALDKYKLYITVMSFLGANANVIVMEEYQWLFDKNTYLNEFGTIRKEKGFLKKCKELSNNHVFFDMVLSNLD